MELARAIKKQVEADDFLFKWLKFGMTFCFEYGPASFLDRIAVFTV
jgi:hypothetical protein